MCQNPIPLEEREAAKTCTNCGADLSRWIPKPAAPPPLALEQEPPSSSFPKQAATFSLVAPLVSFMIGIVLQPQVRGNRVAMIILGLTSTFLIIGGLILGIVALVATRRYGREGVFGRALVGTCINGLLVLLILIGTPGLIRAIERAKAQQRQQMEQRQP
jgi:hypothetical protein